MPKRKKKDTLENQVEELNSVRLTMSRFFRKMGLDLDESIQLSLYIEDMASINTTARLESKIDAQTARYNLLLWVVGVGAAVISITLTLIATLGGAG